MNKLTALFTKARVGLTPYEKTPEAELIKIAKQCGRNEIAAINIRLKYFHARLEMVEEWDGDEQDIIWEIIEEHRKLLRLIAEKKPT